MSPPILSLPALRSTATTLYPGRGLGTAKNRFQFLAAALRWRAGLTERLDQPTHARLLRELMLRPQMMGFVRWPYIHCEWPALKRFDALSQHFQALEDDMAMLDIGIADTLEVADLGSLSPGLRLVIDRAPWCLREGSLVFSQFVGDHRLLSIAFSFARVGGERIVYVGSVQGSNAETAQDTYREVAKDLLGMRARDFTIKAFQLLMHALGVRRILCIGERFRHHRHPYFAQDKVAKFHLDYDVVWQEHNGEPVEGGFYRLDMLPRVRPMEEIARKNRSLYRKRYALMDELAAAMAQRFGPAPPSGLAAAHAAIAGTP